MAHSNKDNTFYDDLNNDFLRFFSNGSNLRLLAEQEFKIWDETKNRPVEN
jgi:hypothetical protein